MAIALINIPLVSYHCINKYFPFISYMAITLINILHILSLY